MQVPTAQGPSGEVFFKTKGTQEGAARGKATRCADGAKDRNRKPRKKGGGWGELAVKGGTLKAMTQRGRLGN